MDNYFDGYYYKHQKGNHTLCLIAGQSASEKFIQVITNDFSEKVPFTKGNPSSYLWIQANDFQMPCSIMAAVADIPFFGLHFRGCICIIQCMGREYRLATYLGVRVLLCTRNRLVLQNLSFICMEKRYFIYIHNMQALNMRVYKQL